MPARGGRAGGCMWERCITPLSDLATLEWSGNRIPGGAHCWCYMGQSPLLPGPVSSGGGLESEWAIRRDAGRDGGTAGPLSVGMNGTRVAWHWSLAWMARRVHRRPAPYGQLTYEPAHAQLPTDIPTYLGRYLYLLPRVEGWAEVGKEKYCSWREVWMHRLY